MKLHLPSSLRKALLSCLAALASVLPATLSSGSALFASGAMAAFILSQQVAEASITVNAQTAGKAGSEEDGYTIGFENFLQDEELNVAGQEIIIDVSSGNFYIPLINNNSKWTINADVVINSAVWYNGYSNRDSTLTFAGSISGSGDFAGLNNPTTITGQTFIFTGNMSNYSGNMSLTAGGSEDSPITLRFAFADSSSTSGTGNLTTTGNGHLVDVVNSRMVNAVIDVTRLSVSGVSSFSGATTVKTSLSIAEEAEVSFDELLTLASDAVTFTIGDGASVAANGGLVIASSGTQTISLGDGASFIVTSFSESAEESTLSVVSTGDSSEFIINNAGGLNYKATLNTDAGVTLVKRGDGMLVLGEGPNASNIRHHMIGGDVRVESGTLRITGAAVIGGDVEIASGATLSFWKAYQNGDWGELTKERVIRGRVSGGGSIAAVDEQVDIIGGGVLGGNLIGGWNNSAFALGDDLTVGGFAFDTNQAFRIKKSVLEGAKEGDVVLGLNVTGMSTLDTKVTFEEHVNFAKKGSGILTVTDYSKFEGGVIVDSGTLKFSQSAVTLHDVALNGGVLDLSAGGSHTMTSLTVNGDVTLKLSLTDVAESGALITLGSLSFGESGALVVDLGNVSRWTNTDVQFNLFAGVDGDEWLSRISLKYSNAASGKRITLSSTGYVLVLDEDPNLTWNGSDNSFSWNTEDSNKVWSPEAGNGNVSFSDSASVTFNGSNASGEVVVTVDSAVYASNMSISGGDFRFTDGRVNVHGDLQFDGKKSPDGGPLVEGDYTVTFEEYLTVEGALKVYADGMREDGYDGAKLVLKKGGSIGALIGGWGAHFVLGDDLDLPIGAIGIENGNGDSTKSKFSSYDSEKHYLHYTVNSDMTLTSVSDSESNVFYSNIQFAQFDDGEYQIGVKKTGSGTLYIRVRDKEDSDHQTVRLGTDLLVESGMLEFGERLEGTNNFYGDFIIAGNLTVLDSTYSDAVMVRGVKFQNAHSVTIEGRLDVTGDIAFYDSQLTLAKGGRISGWFRRGWGARLILGDDLEMGWADNFADNSANGDSRRGIDGGGGNIQVSSLHEGSKVYLLVANNNSATNAATLLGQFTTRTDFTEDVGFGVSGAGTLTVSDAATINKSFKVKTGTVVFAAGGSISGDLLLADGGVVEMGANMTVGSFTGSADGSLKVLGGKLTVGSMSGELAHLEIAADASLAVNAGTVYLGGDNVFGVGSVLELADGALLDFGEVTNLGNLKIRLAVSDSNRSQKIHEGAIDFDLLQWLDDSMLGHGQSFVLGADDQAGYVSISGEAVKGDLVYSGTDAFTWMEGDSTKRWEITNDGLNGPAHFVSEDNVHFDASSLTNASAVTITVDGAVTVNDLKLSVGANSAGYAFAAADDSANLTVLGDITLNMAEDKYVAFAHKVTLARAQEGPSVISGPGTVRFVKLLAGGQGITISNGAHVETDVDSSASGQFDWGVVNVEANSTLTINVRGGNVGDPGIFTSTSKVQGAGSLEIVVADLDMANCGINSYPMCVIKNLLDHGSAAIQGQTSIYEVHLVKGANAGSVGVHLGNASDDTVRSLQSIEHLYIEDGVTLRVHNPTLNYSKDGCRMVDADGNKVTNVLHLSGYGTNSTGALSFSDGGNQTVAWNVELESDASIVVVEKSTGTISGAFDAKGHALTLTINALGTLAISNLVGDEWTEGVEGAEGSWTGGHAGNITVSSGTLDLQISENMKVAKNLTVATDAALSIQGNSVYTVETVEGGGSIRGAATAILRIDTATLTDNVTNGAAFSLQDVGLAVKVNSANGQYYALSGATLTNLASLSVEKGIFYLFGGNTLKEHSIAGGVSISEGATWYVSGGSTQQIAVTVGGALSGKGTLGVVSGTLTLSSGGMLEGVLDIRNSPTVELGQSLTVGGFDTGAWNGGSGDARIVLTDEPADDVTLTINVGQGVTRTHAGGGYSGPVTLTIADGIAVKKTGEGTQVFRNLAANEVTVQEGTLRFTAGGKDTDAGFYVKHFTVQENGVLDVAKTSWQGAANSKLTLENGGELKLSYVGSTDVHVKFATLELVAADAEAQAGSVAWAELFTATGMAGITLTLGQVTGLGSLEVESQMTDGVDAYRQFVLESMLDYTGTISGDAEIGGKDGYFLLGAAGDLALNDLLSGDTEDGIRVAAEQGNFHQTAGNVAYIDVIGGVVTDAFRMTGQGELHINKLTVNGSGSLFMNYDDGGVLAVDSLSIGANVTFYYTNGSDANVLHWGLADMLALAAQHSGNTVGLDIWTVAKWNANRLTGSGINLGIYGTAEEIAAYTAEDLKQYFELAHIDEDSAAWSLHWSDTADEQGRYYLYLTLESFSPQESDWDWHWMDYNAPSNLPQLRDEDLAALGNGPLALAGKYTSGERHAILLHSGPTSAEANTGTVIGGALYTEGSTPASLSGETYIHLKPENDNVRYHLLVGGSSCRVAGEANTAAAGFVGSTHIQMEGGTVDYIVGGNHVTNTPFSFNGQSGGSHISVVSGSVTGGIVGGSAVTRAFTKTTGEKSVYEFRGNSFIYIYTALAQGKTEALSGMDLGDGERGAAFAAVVGGNAWIARDGSVTGQNPIFLGSSHITIDLSMPGMIPGQDPAAQGAPGTGLVFAKDIVGGNYTAYSGETTGTQGSEFNSDGHEVAAEINITTGDTEVRFTGDINGASRRASAGAGDTIFTGNTGVTINGGAGAHFEGFVAGGFWFEEQGATGAHASTLTGDTRVTLKGGNYWRVVGGSVSLAGAGSTSLAMGDSYVSIEDATFTCTSAVAGEVALVAGGDFYRGTGSASGSGEHRREGIAHVSITGGTLTGVHVVGGDYANFTGSSGSGGPVIEGGTEVYIGGDARVTGLVVGAGYLTDSGRAGTLMVQGAPNYAADGSTVESYGTAVRVEISEDAAIYAEAEGSAHKHSGLAVVAGHVLVDDGDMGAHTVEIRGGTSLVMSGGEVHGDMAGGSYASDATGGVNTLRIVGDSEVLLSGGKVYGNVYGGHYSHNTSSPDVLELGNVSITLDGGAVKGDIVGGNFRAATAANSTPPTQGNITVTLESGMLDGNVYAAGEHAAATSSNLAVSTQSTLVVVGSSFAFGDIDGATTADSAQRIVSGGYKKASASDVSSIVDRAALSFSESGAYANMAGVVFRDFDTVIVNHDRELGNELNVLDRGADTRFTKAGSGTLTLANGVHMEGAASAQYTGKLVVSEGILVVKGEQQVTGGLGFDLAGIGNSGNTLETALLQGDKLLVGDGSSKISLSAYVTGLDGSREDPAAGTYYLATGLDVSDLWQSDTTAFKLAEQLFDRSSLDENRYDLLLREDGTLILRAHREFTPGEWVWNGSADSDDTEGNTWTDDAPSNWLGEEYYAGTDDTPAEEDVIFDASTSGDVFIAEGGVTPDNIYVTGGQHTFRQLAGSEGLSTGNIIVGGEEVEAELELALQNTRVEGVYLEELGTLTLSHGGALTADPETLVYFHGGMLAYNEDENGELFFKEDISRRVKHAPDDAALGKVLLRIGKSSDELATAPASTPTLTVGGQAGDTREGNDLIGQMFEYGLEKSGRGVLEVAWTATGEEQISSAELGVTDGTLRLAVALNGGTVSLNGAGATLDISTGASLEFVATGNGTLDIARSFRCVDAAAAALSRAALEVAEDLPRAVVGSDAAADQGSYRLSGDNSDFCGVIELRGNSAQDSVVQVADAAALGGADATLELNGRHIILEDGASATIAAGVVRTLGSSVNYIGGMAPSGVNASITLTGALAGDSGVLAAGSGARHTLLGDVTAYTGSIAAVAADSVWTLAGTAPTGGIISARFAGHGAIEFAYLGGPASYTLSGKIGDDKLGKDTSLKNSTDGILILANAQNSVTGRLIFGDAGNGIQIGTAAAAGSWLGNTLEGVGTLTLVSGTTGNITSPGAASVVVNAAKNATVHVNGTDGAVFAGVTINDGSHLSAVSGVIDSRRTQIELHIAKGNLEGEHMVSMASGDGIYIDSLDQAAFAVSWENKAFVQVLKDHRDENYVSTVHVVENGELMFGADVNMHKFMVQVGKGGNAQLLAMLGFLAQADGGDLALTGTSAEVYLVLEDGEPGGQDKEVHEFGKLSSYKATVVDENQDLTLNVGDEPADAPAWGEAGYADSVKGGLLVNNLVGLEGSTLTANNTRTDGEDATVVLDNSFVVVTDDEGLDKAGNTSLQSVQGADTLFEGAIIGNAGVNFKKTGAGMLTIGSEETGNGGLQLADGDMRLANGGLTLHGSSSMNSFTFAYGDDKDVSLVEGGAPSAAAIEKKGLIVMGEAEIGSIVEDAAGQGDNEVKLGESGRLTLTGDSSLADTSFSGSGTLDVDGSLALTSSSAKLADGVNLVVHGEVALSGGSSMEAVQALVEDGGSISLSDDSAISGASSLNVQNGTLSVADAAQVDAEQLTIGAAGAVTVSGAKAGLRTSGSTQLDGTLDLGDAQGNVLSGLSGSGLLKGSGATVTVAGQGSFSGGLHGYGVLSVAADAALTLTHVAVEEPADGLWSVSNSGSLTIDLTKKGHKTYLADLTLESGSTTTLQFNTDQAKMGQLNLENFTARDGSALVVESSGVANLSGYEITLGTLSGSLSVHKNMDIRLSGAIFLHYEAEGLKKKGDSLVVSLKQVRDNLFRRPGMEKNALAGADMFWEASSPDNRMWERITGDPEQAAQSDLYRIYSAMAGMLADGRDAELGHTLAAGAGASISVLGSALAQDLQRQLSAIRTRTAGMGGDALPPSEPVYHVWINGEGSFHKLSSDGLAPGYSLNSWGGTLGVDLATDENTTMGVALTAMYGDLKAQAADTLRGDMDTMYVSAFARVAAGSWMHTFVVSGGVADVSLNRSVSYSGGSYGTRAKTNGYAVGALYELGHASIINADGTFVVQPIFNVEVRHGLLKGYTESGSDAGLKVGDISHTVVTFGLGARTQNLVGGESLNRSVVLESRALLKADVGDRSGKVNNTLINSSTARELESAEVGAVGIELGAGISIPVGSGSIFLDAAVELRSGYTNVDANIGYRMTF